MKIIINADGAIYGRVCSYAAKKALEGHEVIILNSEKTIMTGNRNNLIEKYHSIRAKGGHSSKGPRYSNIPYKMLKRGIRGMLPDHTRGQGKEALKRVKCFNGIPEEFKDEKKLEINAPKKFKFIELKDLSKNI